MINAHDTLCCGCAACAQVCPKSAIELRENEKGFLYPVVNEEHCVQCGLCDSVCPIHTAGTDHKEEQTILAVKHKSKEKRAQSQSGGAFAGMAETVLAEGGIVYGVALNDELEPVYTRVADSRKLPLLKGSKYVQAKVGNAFREVADDLNRGRKVLFSGTPCHVDGLLGFLKSSHVSTEGLFTVDLVCHGVPSPKIYRDYKELLSERHGNKPIRGFNFRDKSFGWYGHVVVVVGKKKYRIDDYVKIFYSNLALRDNCFECAYANMSRCGDVTIGDCWGIEKFAPEFADNEGVSLLLLNTEKGKELWHNTAGYFDSMRVDDESKILQRNLYAPTEKPKELEKFWEDYYRYGAEYCFYRYCKIDPESETEVIAPNQYAKRAIRKAKRFWHRVFPQ